MRKNVSIEDRTRAIQRGVREALRESALLGHPVCVSRDGKIIWLTPEEVLEKFGRAESANGSVNGAAQDSHD
jgi:hypothetical protein